MSPKERSGLRGFAERWPFRRKLNVLLGVPLAVIGLLLAYLVTDLLQDSQRARAAARLVRDSTEVAALVDRLEAEHQQAVLLSVRHEASEGAGPPSTAAYRAAQRVVDEQLDEVRRTFGDRLPDTEAQALREVEALDSLRGTVEDGYLPAENIDPAYAGAARGLIDGLGLNRDSVLTATYTGGLLDALLRAGAAHGAFETGVFAAGTRDSNALIQLLGAVGSYEQYTYQADRFTRLADEEQAERLRGIEHNSAQAAIDTRYAELQIDPSGLQAGDVAELREGFRQALAAYPEFREQAGVRLAVTTALIGDIADRADSASADSQIRAALLLGLALLGCAVWLGLSVVVRRSVVRPVTALTAAAQEVAEVAGRELARVADEDAEDDGPPRLRSVPVTARDEIGDLADAFNRVQTTAAALLERQVLSRRNVAEMFGHVGRRVSNLTTRQLALIDAVERGETDPALLERLYRIDHIAVRLRRNADSLMLLAGLRETVLHAGPTALTNVVRAALGQIEGYQRVELHAGTEALVSPDVTGDLTLMVAELLDNAVQFSPAGTPVEVAVGLGADGATVTVADHGLGLSGERLAEENARLVRRERLDLVPTQVLGLFVVGALARRWGIGVRLSRTRGGGVTAEVTVPASLLTTVAGAEPESAGAQRAEGAEPAARPKDVALPAGTGGAGAAHGTRPPAGDADGTRAGDADGTGPSSPEPGGAGATAGTGTEGVRAVAAGGPDGAAERPGTGLPATGEDSGGPLPGRVSDTGPHAPLPRRVPRGTAHGPGGAPLVPKPRSLPDPPPADGADGAAGTDATAPGAAAPAAVAPDGPTAPAGPAAGVAPGGEAAGRTAGRPLRRRVRGATLRATAPDTGRPTAPQTAPRADADAVRGELEEFEAAVARAHHDSARHDGGHPDGRHPDGAPRDGAPRDGASHEGARRDSTPVGGAPGDSARHDGGQRAGAPHGGAAGRSAGPPDDGGRGPGPRRAGPHDNPPEGAEQ